MNLKYRLHRWLCPQHTLNQKLIALESMSPYFMKLSEENKREFAYRVLFFDRTTTYNSPANFVVKNEMRTMIAAAFVQMTFGLRTTSLLHYNKIHLVPKKYSYKHIDAFFYGDVNPHTKTISLAWPKVLEGLANPYDGVNLAIHEFAHCLILEDDMRAWNRIFSERALNHWKSLGKRHLEGHPSAKMLVLREYGGKNLMELFAVSLEAFFEKPHALFFESASYYQALVKLLKQDPRKSANPKLSDWY